MSAVRKKNQLQRQKSFLEEMEELLAKKIQELEAWRQRQLQTGEDKELVQQEYSRRLALIKKSYGSESGMVVAMGSDDGMQLGTTTSARAAESDDREFTYPPTIVSRIGNSIVHVAAGGMHSLALKKNGVAYSWGVNDDNTLGRKFKDHQAHSVKTITEGFSPEDLHRNVAIDAGDSHSLFLTIDGNVYQCGMCKSDIEAGKFRIVPPGSLESPKGSNDYPTKVAFPTPIRAIAAGESFSAAISDIGELYTWGMGHHGQLARTMGAPRKPSEDATAPPIFDLGRTWIGEDVGTGEYETDAFGNQIEIMRYSYYLDRIKKKFLTPAPVCWADDSSPKRTVLAVACGNLHILVVARDSGLETKVYSAGHNGCGQLGQGDEYERHELTEIECLNGKQIKTVEAGNHHSLALSMDGKSLFAWGKGRQGQLGQNDDTQDRLLSPTPVAFPESVLETTSIKDISAGGDGSMAITEANEIYTWGSGVVGATGHAGEDDIVTPTKLDVLKQVYDETGALVFEAACGDHSLMIVQHNKDDKPADGKPAAETAA